MNKTEERAFFNIFKMGGVAYLCVDVLTERYNLGFQKREKPLTDEWRKFYGTVLPKQIKAAESTLNVDFDTIFDEIAFNLSECNSDMAKRNYSLSLLTPFAAFLRSVCPTDNETGNTDERAAEIEKGFFQITQKKDWDDDSAEAVFSMAIWLIRQYANRLDWVLLQNGVDLMRLQRESGIWLKRGRLNVDFMQYGTRAEETQRYIDALPQVPTMPNKGDKAALSMPTDKDTIRTEEKPTEPKQRGRKVKSFIDCFVRDTQQADYNRIKVLCDNKQGKELALVILVAISEGIISKPTFRTIQKDCGNIGSESGFNKYLSSGYGAYTTAEIDGMKKLLGL